MAEFEGLRKEGEITDLNRGDKEVEVQTGEQTFWYSPNDLYPIPLDEAHLMEFGFEKQELPDGKVKYLKGPFRMLLSEKGNFSNFEIWYREDRRYITEPLSVHELQNHYHQMTKIDLVRGVKAH